MRDAWPRCARSVGAIGFALGRRILPSPLALPLSPVLGWACHSALALPLYRLVGMTQWTVTVAFVLPLIAAITALRHSPPDGATAEVAPRVPLLAYAIAALVAVVPALAVAPKIGDAAVRLAPPIFDHSKIAIVDDIIRHGVPAGNPFFGEVGSHIAFAYYYLWHFSAAELALLFGASGWDADIALTGFTAFASLLLMASLAVWFSRRAEAALYVPLLAFAASLHPVLAFLLGPERFYSIFLPPTGLAGWLFQTSWAPQHIAATSVVILACVVLVRLAKAPSVFTAAIFALLLAAGYQSSAWVGGVVFGLAAPFIALLLVLSGQQPLRARLHAAMLAGLAALGALVLAYPFIKAQIAVAAAREVTHPIAFAPIKVFNFWVPDGLRPILNIPGYWLALLPIEFPAIFLPGIIALVVFARGAALAPQQREVARCFAVLTAVSLLVTGFLRTTFADNNDLGWRAVLPAVFVLTIFAAAGLTRWLRAPRPVLAGITVILFALSLPRSFELLHEYLRGTPSSEDTAFAQTPALWDAVRRHSAPPDRIANNPLFMAKMTPWPMNISWALLANRRSCYAAYDLAIAFAPLSRARNITINRQFNRVFSGAPEPDDVRELADRFGCRVVVVTPQDGAWTHDPFAASGLYKLVEEQPKRWRIFRATASPPPSGVW